MTDNKNTSKKLTGGIVAIVVLIICLCITTFALVYASVSVENNLFRTGTIKLNLNDGKPVINESKLFFEPGMTVEKDFFIENESTSSVYYRIFFDNISGGLADVLEITVKYGDKILYSGTANELTQSGVAAADDILQMNEKRELTIVFSFPEDKGNSAQGLDLTFTVCAEATQTKNNPDRLFKE